MPRAALLLLCFIALVACSKKPALPSDVVQVKARRIAASKAKGPQDILPYDEAIAWHEYEVEKVQAGQLDPPEAKRIRVAHWTVRHGKAATVSGKIGEETTLNLRYFGKADAQRGLAASDDLEIVAEDPPRYYDADWELAEAAKPGNSRLDYWGTVSDQMKIYWKVRDQIRLAIMGNSHATKGICPRNFYPDINWQTPVAFNLAPPGSNNALQCLVLKEYIAPLPHLEWLIWVVSPRNFNAVGDDSRKLKDFLRSPGHQYDVAHHQELWPVPKAPALVTLDQLKTIDLDVTDWWGWEGRAKTKLPETLEEARPVLLAKMAKTDFKFSEDAWKEFTATVNELKAKGLRILLLTPPFHPVSADAPAADPDGTTHEGQRELVHRLEAFTANQSQVWFRDFNNDGHHDFTHAEFYDEDHLDREGAEKLSERIRSWMAECVK